MIIRPVVIALVAALMLAGSGPASAQQAKCIAGKTKCLSKKATGLLKCEATAETPGKPADPDAGGCRTKVIGKFDGGAEPAKGCFEKLENKSGNDCVTSDDTDAGEAAVDSCVASLVTAIDPPPITQTKCGAGKKKCVSKLLAALLKCNQVAQTPGKSTDTTACVAKATTKYTGGAEPAKGCFAKLEAKSGNDCEAMNDSGTLQTLVENCAAALATLVTGGGSTTSTTAATSTTATTSSTVTTTTTGGTTTTTTMPSGGTVLKGALPATLGRFNFAGGIGLPGALTQCHTSFGASTHVCTYAELQSAETAGDLVGLKDTTNATVTAFWAIDNAAPILQQCNDDAPGTGSGLNWEYGTAHTASRGEKVSLNNGTGALGALQMSQQCALLGTPAWVGCCR
jgi:hypothetical protein